MKKSHEKSIIAYSGYFNMLADLTENGYVILQVEDLGEKRGYLCEYVGKDKYDRTTAEGRAEEAEKKLNDERAAHEEEIRYLVANADAAMETAYQYRDKLDGLQRENRDLRAVIAEIEEYGSIPESARCMMQDIEEGKEVNKHMF